MRKIDTNVFGATICQITCDMCNNNISEFEVDHDVKDIEVCATCGDIFKNYMTDEERKSTIKSVKSIRNSRHIIDNLISKHLAKKIENDCKAVLIANKQKMKEMRLVNPLTQNSGRK